VLRCSRPCHVLQQLSPSFAGPKGSSRDDVGADAAAAGGGFVFIPLAPQVQRPAPPPPPPPLPAAAGPMQSVAMTLQELIAHGGRFPYFLQTSNMKL
jgi:hypothetical protein